MNDPLGLFSNIEDPLGLFSKPGDAILPNSMNANEIPPLDVNKHFKEKPAIGLLDANLQAYREWLGLKSAAQSTAAGFVGFPAGIASGLVDKARGNSKAVDPLIGEHIHTITQYLDKNNKVPPSADKYNEAVAELINQLGVPMMGLHLGVPQPFPGKAKLPEIPKPNIDALKPEAVVPKIEVPDLSIESPTRATMRVAEQNKRGLPTADDFNNRDANVRAVEEEIAANEARQAYEAQLARDAESAKGQEFLNAKQMQIDDHPFGERPPQYGVTDTGGRIDENGIPIRADLSIEAQQLQDPLQRNLWGDELPRKSEQEAARGITAAMDSLPDLPWKGSERDAALERLNRGTLDAPDDLTAAIAEANKTADSRLKNAAGNLLDALLEKAGGKLNMKDSGNSVHKAAQELAIALFDAGHTTLAAAVTKAKEMLGAKWEEIRDIFPKYFNEARIAATYNKGKEFVSNLKKNTREAKIEESTSNFSQNTSESFPTVAKLVSRKDVKELIADIIEAESKDDHIQFWMEKLAGVTSEEDPTLGGQLRPMGRVRVGQAKGPKDFIKFTLTEAQKQELIEFAKAIIYLKDEVFKARKAEEPVYPEPENYQWPGGKTAFYHEDKMKNPQYARDYKKYEDQIDRWNQEADRLNQKFADQYGFNPEFFSKDSLEYGTPEDIVWDAIFGIAKKISADESKAIAKDTISTAKGPRSQRGGLPSRPGGSQKGSVDLDLLTLGLASKFGKYLDSRSAKNLPLAQGTPKDTITHPITPETIAQKTEIRNKTDASSLLKKLAPEFSSVTTPEEAIALAKDTRDINNNPVRDATISGINGQVFLHRNNPVLNFVRYAVQQWRNSTTKFSRDYVTSKEGVATLMQKLSKAELVRAMETLRDLGKAQIELTAENIGKLGLSENVNKFMLSVRKALDAQWEMAADSLQMAGRNAFKPRAGYFPSIATGSYKSLVGVMKDGVFVTKAIAQADTRWDHKKLVEYYKEKLGKEAVVVPFERQGLNKGGITNNLFNGFNDIINTIAKHDPRFAELQQAALMKLNDAHHKLKGFDVHEMHKKGIEGFTGDNPLRTREQNAKEMSKALINFMEQGAEYYSGQKALNDIAKVTTSPDVAHLPNTLKVVEKYQKHVLGMDINPLGGGLNWVLDIPFNALGISPKLPLAVTRGLRTAVGLHMMGLWNPTFTALQLTQALTGAWPKAQDLGSKLNMGFEVSKSASTAAMQLSVIATSHRMGRPVPDFIMPHMKEAFQYALDHGITEFSELETATSATRNKTLTQAEKLAALPIVIGERGTRPPVFMMFADIFHKFGLENQEAFMAAHHATNMAMGDYHPYERPQIYSQLGVLGEFGGALTTFKHNALTNYWTTGKNAISKDLQGNRHLLPAITALAGVALLQGITGMPGYEEADAVYQWATSLMGKRQNIAQAGLEKAPDWAKHGILSAATGLDFQSRASMANVLPDLSGSSLSPQLSVLTDMGMKLYEYNKYRDQHSFNDLMMSLTPSGMKGMTESVLMTNPQGQVTNTTGQLMFNEPRTPGQQTARKWFGVRPLGETPSKEDVYVTSKSLKEREDRESDYANRFRQAFAVGDRKGMEHLSTKYLEMGGDPQVLYNSPEIMQAIQQAGEDQRTRMAGDLAATQRSIRRWQELHPGRK